jgi:methylglutaconyl-CoA hydratase
MSVAFVQTEVVDGVMSITLTDEEHRNALGPQLIGELLEACDTADADPTVRVVVLTNTGRVFCAGASLAAVDPDRGGADGTGADEARRSTDTAGLFTRFRRSPKPYVGRIAGHCVAGGVGLAASLDIAIAADDALFGFTEVRVGVAPSVISVVCLPKMRPADARAAMLRGNRFPAAEAARIGLIHAAVPPDRLDEAVGEVVDDLVSGGPAALAATKRLLDRVPGMDEADAFAWTRQLSSKLFSSDEAAEGMRAFRDKRPASWIPAAAD